jgi:tetratricopeptide (TPR) repeat protein
LAQSLEALAAVYERQERIGDAVVALRRSIKVAGTPPSYNATKRLAYLLEKRGDLEEASGLLESLVSEDRTPSRGEKMQLGYLEIQLADIYLKLERWELAEAYYKSSIRNLSDGVGDDPTYPAVVRLVRLYLQQGRTRDAVSACRDYKKSLGASDAATSETCEKLGKANPREQRGEVSLK